jgi:CHAD domain-containing protein
MGGQETTSGAVIRACLEDKATALLALEGPALRDEYDAVHRMRVATRTLRSTLKTFGALFDAAEAEALDAELRWLGSVLGGARDAEVLEAQLLELLAHAPGHLVLGPVRERIAAELAPRRTAAQETLVASLADERYAALVASLQSFAAEPPLTPAADEPGSRALPDYVDRALRRVRRRMRKALALPPGPERDETLHRARKAARQTRYAAEAVAPVFGDGARRLARRMKLLQDELGAQRDRMVAGEAAAHFGEAAHQAGENAFTFGLLRGYVDCDARTFDERVREAWERVGRGRRRHWSD